MILIRLSFQSSPASWDGRFIDERSIFTGYTWFQSSPASWDGRFLPACRLHFVSGCFNPRPPRGTGASSFHPLPAKPLLVSILARLVGRALLQSVQEQLVLVAVSILARLVGRALRADICGRDCYAMFQSSPASWDGRFTPWA